MPPSGSWTGLVPSSPRVAGRPTPSFWAGRLLRTGPAWALSRLLPRSLTPSAPFDARALAPFSLNFATPTLYLTGAPDDLKFCNYQLRRLLRVIRTDLLDWAACLRAPLRQAGARRRPVSGAPWPHVRRGRAPAAAPLRCARLRASRCAFRLSGVSVMSVRPCATAACWGAGARRHACWRARCAPSQPRCTCCARLLRSPYRRPLLVPRLRTLTLSAASFILRAWFGTGEPPLPAPWPACRRLRQAHGVGHRGRFPRGRRDGYFCAKNGYLTIAALSGALLDNVLIDSRRCRDSCPHWLRPFGPGRCRRRDAGATLGWQRCCCPGVCVR